MGKKILSLIGIGLVMALVLPVVSCEAEYQCKLSAVGLVWIDSTHGQIKGFVLRGEVNGEALQFGFVKISFDERRAPLELDTAHPFLVHTIKYNPAV
jgi:hypothetical protein